MSITTPPGSANVLSVWAWVVAGTGARDRRCTRATASATYGPRPCGDSAACERTKQQAGAVHEKINQGPVGGALGQENFARMVGAWLGARRRDDKPRELRSLVRRQRSRRRHRDQRAELRIA
jgi:hypothetical protein